MYIFPWRWEKPTPILITINPITSSPHRKAAMQSAQNQEAAAVGCLCSLWRDLTLFFLRCGDPAGLVLLNKIQQNSLILRVQVLLTSRVSALVQKVKLLAASWALYGARCQGLILEMGYRIGATVIFLYNSSIIFTFLLLPTALSVPTLREPHRKLSQNPFFATGRWQWVNWKQFREWRWHNDVEIKKKQQEHQAGYRFDCEVE